MQYFYLLNVSFSILHTCLLHWGHHMNVRVVKIMKINLGIIWLLDFKSAGRGIKNNWVTKLFMDGNCNIITEILLVISYTIVTAKSNIITVTSYCPTLIIWKSAKIWCFTTNIILFVGSFANCSPHIVSFLRKNYLSIFCSSHLFLIYRATWQQLRDSEKTVMYYVN